MTLRVRLAIFFAVFTSLTIAFAFTLTLAVFRHAQERSLDQALVARAEAEAEEVVLMGDNRLNIQQAPSANITALSQLVKYGALYSREGAVLSHTITFGNEPPFLPDLGYNASTALPYGGFDFPLGKQILRGVLVGVGLNAQRPQSLLLLAVPRDDLDSDTIYLFRVMALQFSGAVAIAIMFGLWFGSSMTAGINAIARVARRVTEGALEARVPLEQAAQADETRRLAVDLNQMVDRLAAVIDAERRFVSHAAHELRSPLSALRGELELALRHPRPIEGYQQAIAGALDDTTRLQALTEELLTLARVGLTPQRELEPCRLADVVQQAIHASRLSGAACTVSHHIDGDLWVQGRTADLARLVRNLIDNAVEHAPAGSTVRIHAGNDAQAGMLRIAVEDDGVGLDPDIKERIFAPFFRGDDERAESGAGLGLAIAREITQVHGGVLFCESPRHPTRFVVRLPRTGER